MDIVITPNLHNYFKSIRQYSNIAPSSNIGFFYYDPNDHLAGICRIYCDTKGRFHLSTNMVLVKYGVNSSITTDNEHILEDLNCLFKMKAFW